jgi:hypothetical protein
MRPSHETVMGNKWYGWVEQDLAVLELLYKLLFLYFYFNFLGYSEIMLKVWPFCTLIGKPSSKCPNKLS